MYVQILKTIIGKYLGIDSLLTPVILHLTLTNRCNAKCVMCNIWQEKSKKDITPECLTKYKNSSRGKNLRILDMTGGEPFLCDVPSIIKALDNGKLKSILISTNGLMTNKIERDIKNILDITKANIIIDVSIDGIGKKHDQIRGITGTYEKALKTIVKLKSLMEDRVRISLKFTIIKENIDQLMACYKKAEELGVDFTCKPGTNFGFLQNENMDFELQQSDYDKIIKDLEEISKLRAHNTDYKKLSFWNRFFIISNNTFSDELIKYYKIMREGEIRMITPCYSSFLSVMMHNDCVVYSCPTLMKKIGSINAQSLESIWSSDNAKKIRRFINEKKCACFSQCDQMPALVLGKAPKVIRRVIASYFR
jgi:MoaA/NifB/PqqE/SkfB family radical SAM enzyme